MRELFCPLHLRLLNMSATLLAQLDNFVILLNDFLVALCRGLITFLDLIELGADTKLKLGSRYRWYLLYGLF